jgi:hypothetical protein
VRPRDLIAAGRAEAEQLGMARELVRFERRSGSHRVRRLQTLDVGTMTPIS